MLTNLPKIKHFTLNIILLFLISCSFQNKKISNSISANTIDSLLVKHTYNANNGLHLPYRLYSPNNLKQTPIPLVIFLHGRGDRGTDNGANIYREAGFITAENSLLSAKMQTLFPCYILIPQCSDKTENEEWAKWIGNTPETPFNGLGKDGSYAMNPIPSESGEATLELIEKIVDSLPIDTNRIYLIGISMGGFGTWEFTARKPQLFAAAIPMAGYSDPTQIENIKHISFWIFHGKKDEWNPVAGSQTMYQLLSQQNADVKYTEYENLNHGDAFEKAFNEPNLIPWLFSKTKTN
jgi:predicted peptidase